MGSTVNDENLELWAFTGPTSLQKSIGRVVACQSSTANLELWAWSCGLRSARLASG